MIKRTKKQRIAGFFIKLFIVLAIIGSIGVGAFFILDKAVVPSYFGKYGIGGLGDLVQMVKVMHNAPNESKFITNPYTKINEDSVIRKLKNAGIPVDENNTILFDQIADGDYVISPDADNEVFVSDKEMSAILSQMFKSEYLLSVEYFKNLDYFNTISIEAKEIIIEQAGIDSTSGGYEFSDSAHVSFTIKLDTKVAQSVMAEKMDVPFFLLNLIMPDFLYMTTSYDIEVLENGNYEISNAEIGVNGRTPKQSRILLNMLLAFIYPEDENMTISKLGETFASALNDGMNILGDIKFCRTTIAGEQLSGIMVKVEPQVD